MVKQVPGVESHTGKRLHRNSSVFRCFSTCISHTHRRVMKCLLKTPGIFHCVSGLRIIHTFCLNLTFKINKAPINKCCTLLQNQRRAEFTEHLWVSTSLLSAVPHSLVSFVEGKFTEAGKAVSAFVFVQHPAQRRSAGAVFGPLLSICSHLHTSRLQQAIKAKVPKYCKCA